jgi:nickel/cobalt transporter (NiCoT) family protein
VLVFNSQKLSVTTTALMAPDARVTARLRSSPLLIPFVLIAVFHAAGWGIITMSGSTAIGAGVVAYLLGLRHACDADHIIAIDGASRAVVAQGRPAPAIGFYFSLGHSAVVLVVTVMLTVGLGIIGVNVGDDSLRLFGATIGSALSGGFLLVIGALNVGILVTILARRIRPSVDRNDLFAHRHRTAFGGFSAFLGPVLTRLDRPGRMFLVGVLFGFGLDTALSIVALVAAGDASHPAGPIPLAFGLPLLFLAGMSLGDTVEGLAMSRAYRWAAEQPGRRWIPNVIITGASAVAAVVVGMIVLAGAGIAGTVAVAIVGGVGLVRAAVAGMRQLRDPRNPLRGAG